MLKLKSLFLGAIIPLLVVAGVGSAQTISIVSGNGQLACAGCFASGGNFQPMVVVVKDASGNPVAGRSVTWAITRSTTTSGTSGSNTLQATTTTTGTDGTAQNTLFMFPGIYVASVNQSTVTASIGTSSVTFTETQEVVPLNTSDQVTISFVSPQAGTTYRAAIGESLTPAVQVRVQRTQTGAGIEGVELAIVAPDPAAGPSVACQSVPGLPPNTVLSDSSGTATCNLVATGKLVSGQASTGQFTISVGGGFRQAITPFTFTLTPGGPGLIKIISGNNQSANPGANLSGVLVAEIDDLAGNPIPGVAVTWDVPQGSATLSQTSTTTNAIGRVQTRVTMGPAGGTVQVRVRVTSVPTIAVTFTATANLLISGMSKVSGDNQSAVVGTQFEPLVVGVTGSQGQPLPGVSVTFAVASGIATLGSATATTDAQGYASTTVQAGATPGPVTVTATAGSSSQTFNLTVSPPGPSITSDSFYNAAGLQKGWVSPCSLATIIAPGLAPGIQGAVVPGIIGPLPYVMANVSVQFGNAYAPIYSVVNNYSSGMDAVTVQVPCEVTPGTVPVTVRVGAGSATVNLTILNISPGIFQTVMSDNKSRAVLLRPDGSYVTLENPARRGEIIRTFVTGLGPVDPPIGTNQAGIPDTDQNVTSQIVVGVNNAGVRVVSAKYAENLIGIYEVDFQVPSDTATGNDVPFAVAVTQGNNLVFGNGSALPIQ